MSASLRSNHILYMSSCLAWFFCALHLEASSVLCSLWRVWLSVTSAACVTEPFWASDAATSTWVLFCCACMCPCLCLRLCLCLCLRVCLRVCVCERERGFCHAPRLDNRKRSRNALPGVARSCGVSFHLYSKTVVLLHASGYRFSFDVFCAI